MTAVPARNTVDGTSQPFSTLRHIRQKIARKEAEVAKIVDQARRNSDRRLLVSGSKLDAENELEQALIERTVLKGRSLAAEESLSKASPLLEQTSNARRIDLLAASPPFIVKLEQALATVATVDRAAVTASPGAPTRWRSSLKRLMKDASDGMDRYKHLASHGESSKEVESELALAAVSARRVSTHVNAWSLLQLALEFERIWLQAVLALAKDDAKFQHLVDKWQEARKALGSCASAVGDAALVAGTQQDILTAKIRHCQVRAGVGPKAKKVDWRNQRNVNSLCEEMRHLELKMAPLASPSYLKARYNVLLAKCAEAGAWTIAVAAYRSMGARGIIAKDTNTCNTSRRFQLERVSLERGVFQYLLRAAKNASPPRPHAAVLVLQEMRSREAEPSAIHYNIVISACARAAAAAAASTSVLLPLENTETGDIGGQGLSRLPRGVGDNFAGKGGGVERDDMGQGDQGGICHKKSARKVLPLLSTSTNDHDRRSEPAALERTPATGCTGNATRQSLLSTLGPILACRDPETAEGAWRLALTVIGDMRRRGIAPTKGTYEAMVECCRYAGTATSCVTGLGKEGERDSTPATVYATLKEAGIPTRFCYQAGLGNALGGGRWFPAYAEIHR